MKTKTTRRRQSMTLRTRFSVQRGADAVDKGNAIPYLHIYYITAAAFCQAFKQGFRFFILNFGVFFYGGRSIFCTQRKVPGRSLLYSMAAEAAALSGLHAYTHTHVCLYAHPYLYTRLCLYASAF